LIKAFSPLFVFVVIESDVAQFIDSGFEARLIFNERLAGFIRRIFAADRRWDGTRQGSKFSSECHTIDN
jgi:hypothetical protein